MTLFFVNLQLLVTYLVHVCMQTQPYLLVVIVFICAFVVVEILWLLVAQNCITNFCLNLFSIKAYDYIVALCNLVI